MKLRKILTVFMAVLMLAANFSIVLADDEEYAVNPKVLRSGYASGTYANVNWSLSSAGSSSNLLNARGDYGVDINMKLRFKFQICYLDVYGVYQNFGNMKTINYGPYYDTTIMKSYTMVQAVNKLELVGVPAGSEFRYCNYYLFLDNTLIATFKDTYIQ